MSALEILANGSFILWFSIIAAIVTIVSLEFRREGWATTFISLAIGLGVWNYGYTIWGFISENLWTSILFLTGYLIVGVVWSFLKWNEFVKERFRAYKAIYDKFIKKHHEYNDKTKDSLCNEVGYLIGETIYSSKYNTIEEVIDKITPEGSENKASITAWITYWPLSLIGTLLNNPLKRLVEYIYSLVAGIYDKISINHRTKILSK